MIQQSFNSLLGSLYQGMAVGEHLKQQKPIASAAQRELDEYKKKETEEKAREERERRAGREELVAAGYTPTEAESIAGDIVEREGTLGFLYSTQDFLDRVESGTWDPQTASPIEQRILRALQSKRGQAAMSLAKRYERNLGLEISLEQQRQHAQRNGGGGNQ